MEFLKPEDYLISLISKASNHYGNLLLEFMDTYNLFALKDASLDQLKDFCMIKGLQ